MQPLAAILTRILSRADREHADDDRGEGGVDEQGQDEAEGEGDHAACLKSERLDV